MNRFAQALRSTSLRTRIMIGAGVIGAFATAAMAAQNLVTFEIIRGIVIPREPFAARITLIGAAIYHSSDEYHVPVTMRLHLKTEDGVTTDLDPFGPYGRALTGNVNWQVDGSNLSNRPRKYTIRGMNPANLEITVSGRSWKRKDADNPSTNNNDWEVMRERRSNTELTFVNVLRNGSPVPAVPGFMGQDSVEVYLAKYIDPLTHTIKLGVNEAIYLFELGTNTAGSPADDRQDLVVLVTLAENHLGLEDQID